LKLDLEPAHFRGDLVRQIVGAIVRLDQNKMQHPILICDEAHLRSHFMARGVTQNLGDWGNSGSAD
jgi:hypothetical protein